MIIEFSGKFDALASAEDWNPYIDALSNLIHAQANGHHIMLPSRQTLKTLLSLDILGLRDRNVVQVILEKYSEYSGLARQLEFTVLVYPNNPQVDLPHEVNQIFRLPLTDFANPDYSRPFQLLVEHQNNDGQFYYLICELLAKEHGFAKRPAFDLRHGGGTSIVSVYETHARINCPTFCIVDSDKGFPDDTYGATADALEKKAAELGHNQRNVRRLTDYTILPIREMENFIPTTILKEAYAEERHLSQTLDMLQMLEDEDRSSREAGTEFMRYFDLKGGLIKATVKSPNKAEGEFALSLWAVLEPGIQEPDVDGIENEFICPGLGQNIVPRVTAWAVRPQLKRMFSAHMRRGLFSQEINDIVAEILSYAAADDALRV
jgi:hypothetical protein